MKNVFLFVFFLVTLQANAQWTTSGADIYNTNAGSVGVGTTAPAAMLHIRSSSSSLLRLSRIGSNDPNWTFIHGDAGGLGHLYLQNGNNNIPITVRSDGFVGMGVTSPSQVLEVNGSGLFTGSGLVVNNSGIAGTYVGRGYIAALNGTGGHNLSVQGKNLVFYAGVSYTEKFRIDSNGYAGLGTAAPVDKLHLVTGPYASYGASGGITISDSYTSVHLWDSEGGNDNGTLDLSTNGTRTLRLVSNGNSYINGGNVGIGTSSPAEKLSVNGNIAARKIKVTQTGWSDYVFDKDYGLRSLASVENFIALNKHLPDVPSAEEVAEKGIDLGDTQALLLRKIEELTLYMIQLKKENENQQKEISRLAKEIKVRKSIK